MAQLKETIIQDALHINKSDNAGLHLLVEPNKAEINFGTAKITFENNESRCSHSLETNHSLNSDLAEKAKCLNDIKTFSIGPYSCSSALDTDIIKLEFQGDDETKKFSTIEDINSCNASITKNTNSITTLSSTVRTNTGNITALQTKIANILNNNDSTNDSNFKCGISGIDGPAIITCSERVKKIKKGEHPNNNTKFFGKVYVLQVEDNKGKSNDVIRVYHEMRKTGGIKITSGTTVCVAQSDIRLKENIKDSQTSGLDLINQIKIREFDWKTTGAHQKIGFVADELEKIDSALTNGGGYDENGNMIIKSVESFYLQGYEVKAIQELYQENQELKKQLAVLTEKVNKLEHM